MAATIEWVSHPNLGETWWMWEEQLAPDVWLLCFKPKKDLELGYWVNVVAHQWSDKGMDKEKVSFEIRLDDVLMQQCIMIETRKKYGAPS